MDSISVYLGKERILLRGQRSNQLSYVPRVNLENCCRLRMVQEFTTRLTMQPRAFQREPWCTDASATSLSVSESMASRDAQRGALVHDTERPIQFNSGSPPGNHSDDPLADARRFRAILPESASPQAAAPKPASPPGHTHQVRIGECPTWVKRFSGVAAWPHLRTFEVLIDPNQSDWIP